MTQLLQAWAEGDEGARDAFFPLVYGELRRIAQNRIRGEVNPTLDATGLAHEAVMRLIDHDRVKWQNRAQFFAVVARLMRRILVDRHRARVAAKRGGGRVRVTLSAVDLETPETLDFETLNRALDKLAKQDPRQAQIVELRFFAGLTIDETAAVVEVSPATLKREWTMARAWLKREIGS